mmetsp:Transcript_78776/g.222730  ORF Transcript_78776/g.222730 Transcript_78776/m.222730 type:complete len:209 (-) Transcript_78776:1459-2085(-)
MLQPCLFAGSPWLHFWKTETGHCQGKEVSAVLVRRMNRAWVLLHGVLAEPAAVSRHLVSQGHRPPKWARSTAPCTGRSRRRPGRGGQSPPRGRCPGPRGPRRGQGTSANSCGRGSRRGGLSRRPCWACCSARTPQARQELRGARGPSQSGPAPRARQIPLGVGPGASRRRCPHRHCLRGALSELRAADHSRDPRRRKMPVRESRWASV